MAFMGMMFVTIFIIILIIHIFLTLTFFVLTAVFKIVGGKKESKKMKTAGTVFLVLGILFVVPIIALITYIAFQAAFDSVTLPNGETKYVPTRYVSKMKSYVKNPDKDSIAALEKLLDKNSSLVFYHDVNGKSVLDDGLEMGNADIVRISLERGAIFDNPERYEHMAYVKSSMDYYLAGCIGRSITEDDIEIVEMMIERNVSTELKENTGYYSNVLGKAAWAVLYNDDTVTDMELEFVQLFVDWGISLDPEFLLIEEVPDNYYFGSKYHGDVARNDNYYKLMGIMGR